MDTGKRKSKATGRLTIESLRQFEGFENVSDEEADDIVKSLEQLAVLLYAHVKKMKYEEVQQLIKDSEDKKNGKKF
jgi:predicted ATP-binding protein involved in virulence